MATNSKIKQLGLSAAFLIIGGLVFVLGTNYYSVFPTNNSQLYRLILAGLLLGGALFCRQKKEWEDISQILYAFFIGITTYFLTSWLVVYREPLIERLGLGNQHHIQLALMKVYEAVIVIGAILLLMAVWGRKTRDLYLRKGRLGLALFIGSCLFFLNAATAIVTGSVQGETGNQLISRLPWALVFSFANALMEELLFRGIFLGRMQKVIGSWGAIIVTTIVFSAAHINATYINPAEIVIYQLILLPLGLLLAYLMKKTDTLWGSVLYHSGSDVFLFYLMPL